MLTDTTALFLSLIFGSIGFGYFIYGKRQSHKIALWSGVALMIYPYFVSNHYAMVMTGIGLMLVPRFLRLD
ncbi:MULTISPECIES: hypothetical protein [Thalassolituus]|jgi:hypothetical protein|uniref:Amino acid transport protein n=2 Tax=Thalassolituus TaxID=187492 RepID=A0A9X2WDE8_9GAMM|nr:MULTISPECIES: hypothetical protein [Thalassolituus]MCT7358374.1 hypothetical protein [Thalassolituus pacificus]UXD88110.1 hypothetical protein HUF19_12030 [Thalassolituus hydrocarboniclasticus]